MMGRLRIYLFGILLVAGFSACSVTRHVPPGQYVVTGITVNPDRTVPREDRIQGGEVERYIRQTENKKFLGFKLNLATYNLSHPDKNGRWHKFLRRTGEEPVLLDTNLVKRSAVNITNYLTSRGYFDARTQYSVDTARGKATVSFSITQNEPYRIGEVSYYFRDEFLRPVILQDTAATLLHSGDMFDYSVLNAERSRISSSLKDLGYYYFNVNNIRYFADTLKGKERTVDLVMFVNQYLSGYNDAGEAVYENNPVYRIEDIYINPDYDASASATDPDYYSRMDTVEYRGLKIISQGNPKIRKHVLRRTINLYPGELYNATKVQQAYSDIMRLGYYRNASIVFEDITDSTNRSLITFIGLDDDDLQGPVQTTTEGYMKAHINAIPALKQGYTFELEGSTSSNFYAVGATVSYLNRNLFRGAELLEVTGKGLYEFVNLKGSRRAFEIGASVGMTFPRFVFPLRIDPFNRAVNPRTRFELAISSQSRVNYKRTVSSLNWGYSWSNKGRSSFTLRPVDVNLVKMGNVKEGFLESLKNPYLENSYSSQLIAGISGSYVLNNQLAGSFSGRSLVFRVNWETMGNLFSGLTRMFSNPVYDAEYNRDYYKIFGIRFAQYVRAEASVSQRIPLGPKTSIVYRFLAGMGKSYANSYSVPFDRLFYSGGGNSMRGWVARTLGPGSSVPSNDQYPSQTGNFKLEANLEGRFPVWGLLHGAAFLDAGNVWFLSENTDDEKGVFKIDRFARQLGLNTGLGVRLDFGIAVIRLDWGIKLHDPNRTKPWIDKFRLGDTSLHLGVGYPF